MYKNVLPATGAAGVGLFSINNIIGGILIATVLGVVAYRLIKFRLNN